MWSQSVIVEVYAFSVASLMIVLLCLLRWIYAPHQRRYLYWALFFHGICFTNHQTLIVAAMGIEVAIAAANYRMGRYLFLGNSIIYLCGLILKANGMLNSRTKSCGICYFQRCRDLFDRLLIFGSRFRAAKLFRNFAWMRASPATVSFAGSRAAFGTFSLCFLALGAASRESSNSARKHANLAWNGWW